jgi:hypothetical protein
MFFFLPCIVFKPPKFDEIGSGDGEIISNVSNVATCEQGCNGSYIQELPHHSTTSQIALGL